MYILQSPLSTDVSAYFDSIIIIILKRTVEFWQALEIIVAVTPAVYNVVIGHNSSQWIMSKWCDNTPFEVYRSKEIMDTWVAVSIGKMQAQCGMYIWQGKPDYFYVQVHTLCNNAKCRSLWPRN